MINAICDFYNINETQLYLQFFIGFWVGIIYAVMAENNVLWTAYCNYRWCRTFWQLSRKHPEYSQAFWNSLSKQHNRSRI